MSLAREGLLELAAAARQFPFRASKDYFFAWGKCLPLMRSRNTGTITYCHRVLLNRQPGGHIWLATQMLILNCESDVRKFPRRFLEERIGRLGTKIGVK